MRFIISGVVLSAILISASLFAGSADAASRSPFAGRGHAIGKLATPGGGAGKQCNGKTTSECCQGLSYCGCLYMPGSSSDNHPTSCHAGTPPPAPKG